MEARYDITAEKRIQDSWQKNKIYAFDRKSKAKVFSHDTPPPTVSGTMHIGHACSYSQADFIMRFKRMQGYNVFYPWGFDDNGLATERFVEKKCKVKSTHMTREEFVNLCLKETKEVEKHMLSQFMSLGLSPDLSVSYHTIDKPVQKVSQASFIDIYNMGREYRKEAPIIWCPKCQTAIAQVELTDKEFHSHFNDIVFKVDGKELLIATTRPELLPSCVAVFYHPEDKRYQKLKGKKAIVPLLNFEVPIIEDIKVDMEKGTGLVMCCTFGDQNDVEWYKAHKLPLKMSFTNDGKMSQITGKYQGQKIEEARKEIIADLKTAGLLKSQTPISHAVNVHERCDTPVEFVVSKQWFIKYLDLRKQFLKLGNELNWQPKHMKARYDNWVKGLAWDWCISRQRYFGIPIPVWYCENCDAEILADKKQLPVDPLQNKPLIDKCPKCGCKKFIPEKDVLDTWATSSLTPQIAGGWIDDPELYKKVFPYSLRTNAHDIITFWQFNTIVKSWLHEKKLPWADAMIHGFVLDPKGDKMSKSKGNVVHPEAVLEKFGADALRFWAAGTKLGEDLPYMEKELVTGQKFLTKLWNASRFTFMNLENYSGKKPAKLEVVDEWILHKLNYIVKESTSTLENYEFSKTRALVEQFFWHDFCDNYLEMVKYRLYSEDEGKLSAQYTLYKVLLTVLKLIAPIMPHITEELYTNFFKKTEKSKSIHISAWPVYEEKLSKEIDAGNKAVDIISAIRKFKSLAGVSLRAEVCDFVIDKSVECELKEFTKTILATTNAKELSYGKPKEFTTELFKVAFSVNLV